MAPPPSPPRPVTAYQIVSDIVTGRHPASKAIPILLWLADAVLCGLIIWKISYTEIDWVAYMQQVRQVVAGEWDYTMIKGDTGPLVYPAMHVYIYTALYYLTDHGKDIYLAQQLFGLLYMATIGLVMLCYWQAKVPPYIFPLLILSKRLHSIFVLRCFNDCFAAFFLWFTIHLFQRRAWLLGSIAYTLGLGVKMSLLLVLPAVAVTLFFARGLRESLRLLALVAAVQFAVAIPFLTTNATGYLARAFELTRQFKFEWTVNWRMLGEDLFLDKTFALTLLVGHVVVLLVFVLTRWMQPLNRSISSLYQPLIRGRYPISKSEEIRASRHVTPRYIMTTILSANIIGLLFARSLHYQFYAYLAWATPYLLWRGLPHQLLVYPVWLAQEWAWNVFPSTNISSLVVVCVLAITVVSAYSEAGESMATKRPATNEENTEDIDQI